MGDGDGFVVCARSISDGEIEVFRGSSPDEALDASLGGEPRVETFLMWEDQRRMCAVDFDCERGSEFDLCMLLVLLEGFQPQPRFAWTTHGGGVRLVYIAQGEHTADEAAAVAASLLGQSRPHRGLELKCETRHPAGPGPGGGSCSEVLRREQRFDRRSFVRFLGVKEASDADVAAWLEARCLEVGARYDHEMCPVDPSGRGGRMPVLVGEQGVKCFVCEAAGVCAGSSKPGFFPYSHLCGARKPTVLLSMLENATHWEHAKMVAPKVIGGEFCKLVYSAGVAEFRGRRDADRCFACGRDFVRIKDRWTNLCGEPYHGDVRPILSTLPACTFVGSDGKVRVDRAKVTTMAQPFDLARYGYPSVEPVFGCAMWPDGGDAKFVTTVVQTRELSRDEAAPLRPRYEPPGERMPEAEARSLVEECCPGFSWELVQLLVAARGVAEGASSEPPMVLVTGPTGASKSMSSFLAASICGDRNTEVVWSSNVERMRQAVIDASSCGAFVTFNEVFKEARAHAHRNGTLGSAMDYVLNLTPDSVSHYMYVGPVHLGKLPVFVWTDTELPDSIKKNSQLARRIVHVELHSAVVWEGSLRDTGVHHPKRFRVSSERRARAANAILSNVIDRFFRPPKTFREIACELGFGRMVDSPDAEEGRERLLALFEAVCAAPPLSGSDATRWKGQGWKSFSRDVETPLRDAWADVADEDSFFTSRTAGEADWQQVAGLGEPAKIEIQLHGSKAAIRFRSAAGNRSTYRTNEELK